MSGGAYLRPRDLDEALVAAGREGAAVLAGGTDLVTRMRRGHVDPALLVDVRRALPAGIEKAGDGIAIGAGTTLAAVAADVSLQSSYAALAQAAGAAASPQLRATGTVGGNLAQHVRCWYYRHPDLRCWLHGGETCYAQIGDHRKHGLETGDCISVAPSDLAAALVALGATVELRSGGGGARTLALHDLYRRPSSEHRSALGLAPGELIVRVLLGAPPDVSAYERAGERAAWSFALAGVAAVRSGDEVRLCAIGVTNEPRLLDPADPLRGLDGLPQTGWKRDLLRELCIRAVAAVR